MKKRAHNAAYLREEMKDRMPHQIVQITPARVRVREHMWAHVVRGRHG